MGAVDPETGWVNPLAAEPAPVAPESMAAFERMVNANPVPAFDAMPAVPQLGSPSTVTGCWIVFDRALEQVVPFDNELDALRKAVAERLELRFVEWGCDL